MNFIKSITVKNFFSIKNEITFNFEATPYTIENHSDRVYEFQGKFYNKAIAIYGANASGKTSILKALVFISAFISNELENQLPFSKRNIFTDITESTEIKINFVVENIEYKYTLILNSNLDKFENNVVVDEILFNETDNKEIFNKNNNFVSSINKFPEEVKEIFLNRIQRNKSLIQEFYDTDSHLKKIKSFFKASLNSTNISPIKTYISTDIKDNLKIAINMEDSSNLKEFMLKFFQSIGLDIENIEIHLELDNKEIKDLSIEVTHSISKDKTLEFEFESDGTQMISKILVDIYLAKENNSILIIDELDSIIHPVLVPIILNFLRQNNIQILYTTHNIYNMQYLSHDELFLIEKDLTHQTEIKSPKTDEELDGFENLLDLYEDNYFGALPNIQSMIREF